MGNYKDPPPCPHIGKTNPLAKKQKANQLLHTLKETVRYVIKQTAPQDIQDSFKQCKAFRQRFGTRATHGHQAAMKWMPAIETIGGLTHTEIAAKILRQKTVPTKLIKLAHRQPIYVKPAKLRMNTAPNWRHIPYSQAHTQNQQQTDNGDARNKYTKHNQYWDLLPQKCTHGKPRPLSCAKCRAAMNAEMEQKEEMKTTDHIKQMNKKRQEESTHHQVTNTDSNQHDNIQQAKITKNKPLSRNILEAVSKQMGLIKQWNMLLEKQQAQEHRQRGTSSASGHTNRTTSTEQDHSRPQATKTPGNHDNDTKNSKTRPRQNSDKHQPEENKNNTGEKYLHTRKRNHATINQKTTVKHYTTTSKETTTTP